MPGRLSTHRVVSFHYIFFLNALRKRRVCLALACGLQRRLPLENFQHAHTNGHKKHHDIPVTFFSAAAPCRATFNAEPSRHASLP